MASELSQFIEKELKAHGIEQNEDEEKLLADLRVKPLTVESSQERGGFLKRYKNILLVVVGIIAVTLVIIGSGSYYSYATTRDTQLTRGTGAEDGRKDVQRIPPLESDDSRSVETGAAGRAEDEEDEDDDEYEYDRSDKTQSDDDYMHGRVDEQKETASKNNGEATTSKETKDVDRKEKGNAQGNEEITEEKKKEEKNKEEKKKEEKKKEKTSDEKPPSGKEYEEYDYSLDIPTPEKE